MDDKQWVREKLEELSTNVGEIKVTLALNTQSLTEHMRRTELLEKRVAPLETVAAKWAGVFIAWGILVTGIGVVATILKLMGKL